MADQDTQSTGRWTQRRLTRRDILRYTGPHADEAAGISFLEGNSNLGDAGRLAKSAAP